MTAAVEQLACILRVGWFARRFSIALDCPGLCRPSWPAAVNFGKPEQWAIRHATPVMLRAIEFDQSMMGPKIEAACGFVDSMGKWAAIGALSDVSRILSGEAGTRIAGSFAGKMEFWDN